MPNKVPPPEHTWKKGQSGNPKGRPVLTAEEKAIRSLTQKELREIANLVVQGDINAIKDIARNPSESALRVMLASVIAHVIKRGDMKDMDLLLNRLVGKVKDVVATEGEKPPVLVILPDNGRSKRG